MALLASDHGASVVSHDGEHFTPVDGADAVFDLPDHVAATLLPFNGWRLASDDELGRLADETGLRAAELDRWTGEGGPAVDDPDGDDEDLGDEDAAPENEPEPETPEAPAKPKRTRTRKTAS